MPLTAAEKQKAYRDRQREQAEVLDEEREQEIRDRFGYAKSETSSKAERDALAARIVARVKFVALDPVLFPNQRQGDLRP